MQLNNIVAQQRRALTYREVATGPKHDPLWTVAVYGERIVASESASPEYAFTVNMVEFGRAVGKNLNATKEEAARQALALISQGY